MLLKNALVYNEGKLQKLDVRIMDGDSYEFLAESNALEGEEVFDLSKKLLMPGLVDVHVHLREPGFEHKETIKTGSMAAAAGGFTSICAMPNTNPTPDSVQQLEDMHKRINKDAVVNVYPYACITKQSKGEQLVDFAKLKKYTTAFSDDGLPVESDEIMKEAMIAAAKYNCIIAAHCEDKRYTDPRLSEYHNIKRDLELLEQHACAYHVCHVSSKKSIELIREAKEKGLLVSCETAPHYLMFTKEDNIGSNFVMNPPLGNKEDRDALLKAVADGVVDCIATDHAPHTQQEKAEGAFGIIGLETSFASMYTTLVKSNLISLERLIELMSINPQKIFNLPKHADFTVVDLETPFAVDKEQFKSKGRNTPFDGMKLYGKIEMTICKGEIVWRNTQ